MTTFLAPFTLLGCSPTAIERTGDGLHVHATGSAPDAICPSCSARSDRVHSYYQRSPADLPISDQSVRLHLRLRRFRCLNEKCKRRTFVEPLPRLLSAYARRTDRLAETQPHVGFAVGAEAGARLLDLLRMSTSPLAFLRMLHRHPLSEEPVPRVLGTGVWAWRKGRAWGTILIDLERRRPVDILPDRTADGLKRWLKAHPGIEAARGDRSTEYARGITEGAPEAVQVADRWHLPDNFRQLLERPSWGKRAFAGSEGPLCDRRGAVESSSTAFERGNRRFRSGPRGSLGTVPGSSSAPQRGRAQHQPDQQGFRNHPHHRPEVPFGRCLPGMVPASGSPEHPCSLRVVSRKAVD